MASASALPQTLKSINATKIEEQSKQRTLFEERKNEVMAAAARAPDLRAKARVLLEGVTRLTENPNDAFDMDDMDKDINGRIRGPFLHLQPWQFKLGTQWQYQRPPLPLAEQLRCFCF